MDDHNELEDIVNDDEAIIYPKKLILSYRYFVSNMLHISIFGLGAKKL